MSQTKRQYPTKEVQKNQGGNDIPDNVKKKPEKTVIHSKQQERLKVNFVLDDIRKQLTCIERKAENAWEERYGHLAKDNFQRILAEKCAKRNVPVNFQRDKNTSLPQFKSPIILKSSPEIPRTMAGFVGWRSSLPENNLEVMGKLYISPRTTMEVDDPQQKFIFLG